MSVNTETDRRIEEIKNDKIHGATELARQALELLKVTAERSLAKSVKQLLAEEETVAQKLFSVRPAMAPFFNSLNHFLDIINSEAATMTLELARKHIIYTAEALMSDSFVGIAQIAEYALELIKNGDRIITHSFSSTVVEVLKVAAGKRQNVELLVTRSGPGCTGKKIIQVLASYGLPVTFIDDAALGLYISKANRVMVGADRICADGSLVNGIGTYLLALAADKADIPFYVLCETLKFDPRLRGEEVDLEYKEPSELISPGELPQGVKVENPYFDVTPAALIAGIITEDGLFTPEEAISYMKKG